MYDIDKTQAFLLIEARSQRAEDAFSLLENTYRRIQSMQTPQPPDVTPSATASESALLLTLAKWPINPEAGYLFGSKAASCDVLLDTMSSRGVGNKSFSIDHHHETHDILLKCLARNGIFYRGDTENDLKKLSQGSPLRLTPGKTLIVVVGGVQIALSAIVRNNSDQEAFDRNLRDYIRPFGFGKGDPNVGGLELHGSGSSKETPATRVFKGIWGSYTAAERVGGGSFAWITGCVSETGVTCCIKEAKAEVNKEAKDVFKKEIEFLRRLAHPCIVQYIDRDRNDAWTAMEYASLGDLRKAQDKELFSTWETQAVTYQVLHALEYIHKNGIIHHDIKTGNILVKARNHERIWVKVADFGLSTLKPNTPAAKKGTRSYLAPECFEQPSNLWKTKVDIWALAVVALEILGDCPDVPDDTERDYFNEKSSYADGWHGALENRFEERWQRESRGASDPFFITLSGVQVLRENYGPGYFFLSGERTPAFINPIPVANTRADDASIFRFRKLDAQGLFLIMLEGCYLVSLSSIIEAKCENSGMDQEAATYGVMDKYLGQQNCTFWRFIRTNERPETYINIELAIKICQGHGRTQRFVAVLTQQRALCNASIDEEPGKSQLSLLKSGFTSRNVIAITQEGRMLLVRYTDGFLYGPSVHAVVNKRLLAKNRLGYQSAYMAVDEAMSIPGVMSHDDFLALGAATYTSF